MFEKNELVKSINDNLYFFLAETNLRIYKLCVYADGWKTAQERRDQLLMIYKNHAGRYPSAIKEKGLQVINECDEKNNEWRLNEVSQLKIENDLKFEISQELVGEKKYNEFYGRRMSSPWVGIAVFDRSTEKLLDNFDLEYTHFDEYPKQVDQKVQKLAQTNLLKINELIKQYTEVFFASNTSDKQKHDVIKLQADERRFYEAYIKDQVDFDTLDRKQYNEYSKVSQFISAQQALNSKYPSNYGSHP
jgi:hypothetical protein